MGRFDEGDGFVGFGSGVYRELRTVRSGRQLSRGQKMTDLVAGCRPSRTSFNARSPSVVSEDGGRGGCKNNGTGGCRYQRRPGCLLEEGIRMRPSKDNLTRTKAMSLARLRFNCDLMN